MDVESRRDLQLLEALEQEATITQRTLASRLGMALGLTNLYLKRLIRKGYVKCVTVSPNRLVYSLTPRGVARKARLTYEFMKYSLDFYRDARQHLRRSLTVAVAQRKSVAIFGTGDAAELVFLLVRDMGLELAAVFTSEGDGRLPRAARASHRRSGHRRVRRPDRRGARTPGGHGAAASHCGRAREEDPHASAHGCCRV
jgi:DNA-binding MarR family transcriptional regulator